jgi:hypothetical protein
MQQNRYLRGGNQWRYPRSSTRVQRSQSKLLILLERVTWVKKRAIILERMATIAVRIEPRTCDGGLPYRKCGIHLLSSRYEALKLLPRTPSGGATTSLGEYATIQDHEPKVEGRWPRCATIEVPASVTVAATMALASGGTTGTGVSGRGRDYNTANDIARMTRTSSVKETARMTVPALLDDGPTRAARGDTPLRETARMMIPVLVRAAAQ